MDLSYGFSSLFDSLICPREYPTLRSFKDDRRQILEDSYRLQKDLQVGIKRAENVATHKCRKDSKKWE